jgi:hypothetical protein
MLLTVDNYGKTPGVLFGYAVEFCPMDGIPPAPEYHFIRYRDRVRPGTTGRHIANIRIPPIPRPMLAYGRHWYEDVWNERHSTGFVLIVEANGTHGHIQADMPRAYIDWD